MTPHPAGLQTGRNVSQDSASEDDQALDVSKFIVFTHQCNMSRVTRKPVFRVSDQVGHKSGCAATEDG